MTDGHAKNLKRLICQKNLNETLKQIARNINKDGQEKEAAPALFFKHNAGIGDDA